MNTKRFVTPFVLLALIGAGCQNAPASPSNSQSQSPNAPAAHMGFGKLPSIGATGALGSPEAVSMRATDQVAVAPTAPGTSGSVNVAGGSAMMATPSTAPMPVQGDAMLKIRPIPSPPNLKPVAIKYNLTASMPTIPSDSDVLAVHRPQPSVDVVRGFAQSYGLPGQLVGNIKSVQSVNASWLDTDGYQWSMDGSSGMINWWKQQDQKMYPMADGQEQAPAKVDDAKILAAADAFLRSHGLGAVADQGGTVEQYDNQPCIMKEAPPVPAAADATVSSGAGASTMIYPSPCGYFPIQANVFYGSTREGKPVVDMGGWPSRMSSVNVDTATMEVTGGNVVYAEQTDRSSYPLLDQATVLSRLQAGGRNPVYPWGNETKDIQVTIDKIELAWLRYDSWDSGVQETYYLPAIAASGHVDRGIKGQDPEEYHTTVALVQDDAFSDVGPQPVPMPMMIEGSTGSGGASAGGAVASPPMMVK